MVYVSSSSMFATHAFPMQQIMLKDADVCIMNSLTEIPAANPDAMLRDLCSNLGNIFCQLFGCSKAYFEPLLRRLSLSLDFSFCVA